MASRNKNAPKESEPTNLRRSSRSTRGSVKPLVDLSKEEKEDCAEVDDDLERDSVPAKLKRESTSKNSSKRESIKKEPLKRRTGRKSAVKQEPEDAGEPVPIKGEPVCDATEEINDLEDPGDDDGTYYELSEAELKDINHAFDMNRISDEEELLNAIGLKTAIRSLGFEPRGDEIKKLLKTFAKKGNKINRDGFQKVMALKYGSSPGTKLNNLNDEISRVFNLLDLDKTGLITIENLKSISKELNEDLTEEELHEMIGEADLDGDFKINKQEFQNIMIKTSLY